MKSFKFAATLLILISVVLLGHTFYISAQNAKKIDEIRYAIEQSENEKSERTRLIDNIKNILKE